MRVECTLAHLGLPLFPSSNVNCPPHTDIFSSIVYNRPFPLLIYAQPPPLLAITITSPVSRVFSIPVTRGILTSECHVTLTHRHQKCGKISGFCK